MKKTLLFLLSLLVSWQSYAQIQIESKIASHADDAEEYIGTAQNDPFRSHGSLDLESSDIELGAEEKEGKNPQISGLRFTKLEIPRGAKILSASIEFTVDNISKNENPAQYFVFAEDNVSPSAFKAEEFNITKRTWLGDSVAWNPADDSWATAGDKESTSDLKQLVQTLVNKDKWAAGSDIAFFIKGTGVREAESFSDADNAAKLKITFIPIGKITASITSSEDDAEEYIGTPENDSFRGHGSMDVASSDIELGAEKQNGINPQISGLRFNEINIPRNAIIENAYLQFTVDNTTKNEDPANFFVFAEDHANPVKFSETDFDLTNRTWLNDSVAWNPEAGSWSEIGSAGENERTPNLKALVQAIVNKADWNPKNSIALFIKGTGVREAESFDGGGAPAQLVIEFQEEEVIYRPELVTEIPTQELVNGWDFSLDIKPYFRDNDSELSFEAYEKGTATLPAWLSLDNGVLTGTNSTAGELEIEIKATSDGDFATGTFKIEYSEADADFTLAIFHNNDGESHLLPDSVEINGQKVPAGSVAQFKHTLDSLRNQAQNRAYESIMLSSGDNFLAGLAYNASTTAGIYYDAIALDSLDYDAICLGNHDFDFGTQVLSDFIKTFEKNKAPYLSSNLDFSNVPELQSLKNEKRIQPYTIVEKGGEKIGVIGLTTPKLPTISSPGNTGVSHAIADSVSKYVTHLESENVNKIILISHLQGLAEDIEFVKNIKGIDVIIAGGGDELLANDEFTGKPYSLSAYDKYPIVAKDSENKNVYIVTTPGGYRFLGNLLVDFDENGEVTKVHQSNPVLVKGNANATLTQTIEKPISDYIGALATNVISNSEIDLDFRRETLRAKESNAGNLFADAILYQAQKTHANFGLKRPQVAIQNSGGLRLESILNAGDITEDFTYKIAAFTNIVSIVEDMTPAKFLEIIEHGVAKAPVADGRFPQIAGFEIVFDPSKEEGNKVTSITLADGTKIVEASEVVADAPAITLATIDFTAKGGDAYPFEADSHTTLGATYQQAFYNYLTAEDALNGKVLASQYPAEMNERTIARIEETPAISNLLINEDFNGCSDGAPTDWTIFSVASNKDWGCTDDTRGASGEEGDYAFEANGYKADVASEDWLISPQVSLDGKGYTFSFKTMSKYSGPDLEVYYSSDYTGTGNPNEATWMSFDAANEKVAKGDSYDFEESGEVKIPELNGDYYFAFKYTSNGPSGGQGRTYRVDDVVLKSSVLAKIDFNSTDCELGNWTKFETETQGLISCSSEGLEDDTEDKSLLFNGYGAGAGEAWLVSPKLALGLSDFVLNFASKKQYGGPAVEVLYSTDYSGVGNPSEATWTNIPKAEAAISGSFQKSGDIMLPTISEDAYIAFKYTSEGKAGGQSLKFNLDEIEIKAPAQITNEGAKKIFEIQGEGDESPLVNAIVETEGIVTAIFQTGKPYPEANFNSNLKGFFIQDAMGDANDNTSDGIFVYSTESVNVGDLVKIKGKVAEYFGHTQLSNLESFEVVSSGNNLPDAVTVSLPLSSPLAFEAFEGMRVKFEQELSVTENRSLAFYGELRLSANGLLYQPTEIIDPNDADADGTSSDGNSNVDAVKALENQNLANSITLDDARTGTKKKPVPFVEEGKGIPAGSTVTNLEGVLGYAFSKFRLYPTEKPVIEVVEREALPTFGDATLKVAAFNVLNYFNGDGKGGGFPTSRGAKNASSFAKQSQKIIAALEAMDADVVGLIEIENDVTDGYSALEALVDSLNTKIGSEEYAFLNTGKVFSSNGDSDEIRNAFIYKKKTVKLVGNHAILNNSFSDDYFDTKNRPAITQTFEEIATGGKFTAVVNHLKSKGSGCDALGDPNLSDGQGNCNGTRTSAAGTLATWLESDPTSTGVTNYLILGDLNAYAQEDPVDTLRARGFVNLHDETEHTYVYNGQYGSLDYALANASLQENVTEAHVWHINSEVSPMWSYTESGDNFVADAYRSSDHDPVMVGLKFEKEVVLASSIKKDYSSQLDYSGEPVLVTYTSENVTENSTLLWSVTKGGVTLSLENNTSETFTFTYREEGEYVISLTETLGEQSLTVSTDKIIVLEKIIEPKPELNPSIKKDYSSQLDYSGEPVLVTYTSENVTENSTLLWSVTKGGVALSLENNTSDNFTYHLF